MGAVGDHQYSRIDYALHDPGYLYDPNPLQCQIRGCHTWIGSVGYYVPMTDQELGKSYGGIPVGRDNPVGFEPFPEGEDTAILALDGYLAMNLYVCNGNRRRLKGLGPMPGCEKPLCPLAEDRDYGSFTEEPFSYRTEPLYIEGRDLHPRIYLYVIDKLLQRDRADELTTRYQIPGAEPPKTSDGDGTPSAAGPSSSSGAGLTVGATGVATSAPPLTHELPPNPKWIPSCWHYTKASYEEMVAVCSRFPVTPATKAFLGKACKTTSDESVYTKRAKLERKRMMEGASNARYTFMDFAQRAHETHEDVVWRVHETYWQRKTWMLRNAHGELFYRLHDDYLRDYREFIGISETGQLSITNWCHYGLLMLSGCAAKPANRIMWLRLSFPEQQSKWLAYWKTLLTGVRTDELATCLAKLPDLGSRSDKRPFWSVGVIQDSFGQLNQVPLPSTHAGEKQKEAWEKGLGMSFNGSRSAGTSSCLPSFCVIKELQKAFKISHPWLKFVDVALPGESGFSLHEAVHRMTSGDGKGVDLLRQQKEQSSVIYDGDRKADYVMYQGASRWFRHQPSWIDRVAAATVTGPEGNGDGGERHYGPEADVGAIRADPLEINWKGEERTVTDPGSGTTYVQSVPFEATDAPYKKLDVALVTMMMNGTQGMMSGKKCIDSEGTHRTVPHSVQAEIKHAIAAGLIISDTLSVMVGGDCDVWGYEGYKILQASLEFECRKLTGHTGQSVNPHGEFCQRMARSVDTGNTSNHAKLHLLHTNGDHKVVAPDATGLMMDHYLARAVSPMTTDPDEDTRARMLSFFGWPDPADAEKWYLETCGEVSPRGIKADSPEAVELHTALNRNDRHTRQHLTFEDTKKKLCYTRHSHGLTELDPQRPELDLQRIMVPPVRGSIAADAATLTGGGVQPKEWKPGDPPEYGGNLSSTNSSDAHEDEDVDVEVVWDVCQPCGTAVCCKYVHTNWCNKLLCYLADRTLKGEQSHGCAICEPDIDDDTFAYDADLWIELGDDRRLQALAYARGRYEGLRVRLPNGLHDKTIRKREGMHDPLAELCEAQEWKLSMQGDHDCTEAFGPDNDVLSKAVKFAEEEWGGKPHATDRIPISMRETMQQLAGRIGGAAPVTPIRLTTEEQACDWIVGRSRACEVDHDLKLRIWSNEPTDWDQDANWGVWVPGLTRDHIKFWAPAQPLAFWNYESEEVYPGSHLGYPFPGWPLRGEMDGLAGFFQWLPGPGKSTLIPEPGGRIINPTKPGSLVVRRIRHGMDCCGLPRFAEPILLTTRDSWVAPQAPTEEDYDPLLPNTDDEDELARRAEHVREREAYRVYKHSDSVRPQDALVARVTVPWLNAYLVRPHNECSTEELMRMTIGVVKRGSVFLVEDLISTVIYRSGTPEAIQTALAPGLGMFVVLFHDSVFMHDPYFIRGTEAIDYENDANTRRPAGFHPSMGAGVFSCDVYLAEEGSDPIKGWADFKAQKPKPATKGKGKASTPGRQPQPVTPTLEEHYNTEERTGEPDSSKGSQKKKAKHGSTSPAPSGTRSSASSGKPDVTGLTAGDQGWTMDPRFTVPATTIIRMADTSFIQCEDLSVYIENHNEQVEAGSDEIKWIKDIKASWQHADPDSPWMTQNPMREGISERQREAYNQLLEYFTDLYNDNSESYGQVERDRLGHHAWQFPNSIARWQEGQHKYGSGGFLEQSKPYEAAAGKLSWNRMDCAASMYNMEAANERKLRELIGELTFKPFSTAHRGKGKIANLSKFLPLQVYGIVRAVVPYGAIKLYTLEEMLDGAGTEIWFGNVRVMSAYDRFISEGKFDQMSYLLSDLARHVGNRRPYWFPFRGSSIKLWVADLYVTEDLLFQTSQVINLFNQLHMFKPTGLWGPITIEDMATYMAFGSYSRELGCRERRHEVIMLNCQMDEDGCPYEIGQCQWFRAAYGGTHDATSGRKPIQGIRLKKGLRSW